MAPALELELRDGGRVSANAGRFTAYLPDELELLQELAREQGSSTNYVVRVAVRALLGLPVPAWARARARAPMRPEDRELVLGAERAVQ